MTAMKTMLAINVQNARDPNLILYWMLSLKKKLDD
jgi:hypothetical protein